ncbi:MAG: hypothetical protein ABIQ73_22650 [Acidimicrobiales bacterium]
MGDDGSLPAASPSRPWGQWAIAVVSMVVLAGSAFAVVRNRSADVVADSLPPTVLDGVRKRTATDVCQAYIAELEAADGFLDAAQRYERIAGYARQRDVSAFADALSELSTTSARIDRWNTVALTDKAKLPTGSEFDDTLRSRFQASVDLDRACTAAGVLTGFIDLKDKPSTTTRD